MNELLPDAPKPRQRRTSAADPDAGMTLIEILVAMAIVSVGIFALLGELASDIKQQGLQKSQATALHLADSAIETAKAISYSSLVGQAGTSTTSTPVNGLTYTETKTFQVCSPTDTPNSCTTPASGAVSTVHANVIVHWTYAGSSHSIQVAQTVSDNSMLTVSTAASPLGSCGGSGTTLVVGHLTLSPSSVTVSTAGTPSSAITATLTETGLSNASCVPLTWSDDNGSHQVTMSGANGTFSVTIPASSIKKATPTSGGSIGFTATVPGSQAVPTASLTLAGAPAFNGSCSISVVGLGLNVITLTPLTRNTLLPAGLTCTTANLATTDSVIATYQSGTSTKNLTMTSSNGSTWTATLPAGSTMVNTGLSEGFTFKLTRASDGSTASQNVTATLA